MYILVWDAKKTARLVSWMDANICKRIKRLSQELAAEFERRVIKGEFYLPIRSKKRKPFIQESQDKWRNIASRQSITKSIGFFGGNVAWIG